MKIAGRKSKATGSAVARLLFVCVLLAAGWLAYQNREVLVERVSRIQSDLSGETDKDEHSPAQEPRSTTLETAPAVVEETANESTPGETAKEETQEVQQVEPVQDAAPAPPPVVVEETPDHAAIARTQAWWPKQIVLTKAVALPIIFNGKVAGEASVPPGTALTLTRVLAAPEETLEVVYNGSKQLIPAASTDLVRRALAMKKAAEAKGGTPASVSSASDRPVAQPRATTAAPAPAPPIAGSSVKAAERITLEVVRRKLTRIEGGDWDDKKDRISLKVKFANSDRTLSFDNYKAEVYTFAQSILDPRMTKLVGAQTFTFSLPPFGKHEVNTDECVTAYDTTGARFGHQYQGWIVRIRDASGNLVIEKATTPTLAKIADKLVALQVNQEMTR